MLTLLCRRVCREGEAIKGDVAATSRVPLQRKRGAVVRRQQLLQRGVLATLGPAASLCVAAARHVPLAVRQAGQAGAGRLAHQGQVTA